MKGIYFPLFLTVFLLPTFVSAQVLISEIMYDLEGSDNGREWIEVYNGSGSDIDLASWKLFEAETNHKLTHNSGETILSPGQYAVIADNVDKFRSDWPGYSSVLFDSSFSLKNTGEYLSLRDSDLSDIDSLSYQVELGANGNGRSLQKIDNSWQEANPTPGSQNVASVVEAKPDESNEVEKAINAENTTPTYVAEQQIKAQAGEDRVVLRGADVAFTAKSFGLINEPLEADRYFWNFGDGSVGEGKSIYHTYHYPGDYIAVLSVTSGKYSASDSLNVSVLEDGVEIVQADSEHVSLRNETKLEIDVSLWRIRYNADEFSLPTNTRIQPGNNMNLARKVTGIEVGQSGVVQLLYPNGEIAQLFIVDGSHSEEVVEIDEVTQIAKKADITPLKKSSATKPSINRDIPVVEPRTEAISVESVSPSEAVDTDLSENSLNLAAANPPSSSGQAKWLLALMAVIGVGIAGVLVGKSEQSLADEFDIKEIDMNDK